MCISKVSAHDINKILKLIQSNRENEALLHLKRISDICHWTEIAYKNTGDTVLHYAARYGLTNVVAYLLDYFDLNTVNCKNKDDKTALHDAAQFSQYRICELLLNSGADINTLKRADWTPLMLACTKCNTEDSLTTVEVLLSRGAAVNYQNKDGWTTLHLISREGDENILKLLLHYGVNVDIKTKNGRSALHIAALHGHLNVVNILLRSGLKVNDKDKCGNTALSEAVLGNHLEVCKALLEYGADPTVLNDCDYSLIHLASYEGHIKMIKFILKNLNIDVNFSNKNHLTALHCAARKKKKEAYDYLVRNGASEDILDNHNRTPSDYLNF